MQVTIIGSIPMSDFLAFYAEVSNKSPKKNKKVKKNKRVKESIKK